MVYPNYVNGEAINTDEWQVGDSITLATSETTYTFTGAQVSGSIVTLLSSMTMTVVGAGTATADVRLNVPAGCTVTWDSGTDFSDRNGGLVLNAGTNVHAINFQGDGSSVSYVKASNSGGTGNNGCVNFSSGSDNCTLSRCDVASTSVDGVFMTTGTGNTVEYCEISASSEGIWVLSQSNATIRNNWIHSTSGASIQTESGGSNNLFEFNFIDGGYVWASSGGETWENNAFIKASKSSWAVRSDLGGANWTQTWNNNFFKNYDWVWYTIDWGGGTNQLTINSTNDTFINITNIYQDDASVNHGGGTITASLAGTGVGLCAHANSFTYGDPDNWKTSNDGAATLTTTNMGDFYFEGVQGGTGNPNVTWDIASGDAAAYGVQEPPSPVDVVVPSVVAMTAAGALPTSASGGSALPPLSTLLETAVTPTTASGSAPVMLTSTVTETAQTPIAASGVFRTIPAGSTATTEHVPVAAGGAYFLTPQSEIVELSSAPALAGGASAGTPLAGTSLTAAIPNAASGAAVSSVILAVTGSALTPLLLGGRLLAIPAASIAETAYWPYAATGVFTQSGFASLSSNAVIPAVATGIAVLNVGSSLSSATLLPVLASGGAASIPIDSMSTTTLVPLALSGGGGRAGFVSINTTRRAPNVIFSANVRPSAGSVNQTASAPSVFLGLAVFSAAGTISETGNVPTTATGVNIASAVESISSSAHAAEVASGASWAVGFRALSMEDFVGTVGGGQAVPVGTTDFSMQRFSPILTVSGAVFPDTAVLDLAELAVIGSSGSLIEIPAGDVEFSDRIPIVSIGRVVSVSDLIELDLAAPAMNLVSGGHAIIMRGPIPGMKMSIINPIIHATGIYVRRIRFRGSTH